LKIRNKNQEETNLRFSRFEKSSNAQAYRHAYVNASNLEQRQRK